MDSKQTAQRRAGPGAALVIGAGGGIGSAVTEALLARRTHGAVHAVSRAAAPPDALAGDDTLHWHSSDHSDESLAAVSARLAEVALPLRRVIICNGILHRDDLKPEKALEQVSRHALREVLEVNTVVPALWLAGLAPLLAGRGECVVAVISARVGSIADNHLGGWYSYRASKAALNMLLKGAAIELARRARDTKLLAFHPGTTDTDLSKPFQSGVPAEKLFSPGFVAERLLTIMDEATADGELSFIDYDGKPIPW